VRYRRERSRAAGRVVPSARATAELSDLLDDDDLDAVVLATPVHDAELASRWRARASTASWEAARHERRRRRRAVTAAAEADRILMVGHLLEYTRGRAPEAADRRDELGPLYYLYATA